jgi:hypothetical protein
MVKTIGPPWMHPGRADIRGRLVVTRSAGYILLCM